MGRGVGLSGNVSFNVMAKETSDYQPVATSICCSGWFFDFEGELANVERDSAGHIESMQTPTSLNYRYFARGLVRHTPTRSISEGNVIPNINLVSLEVPKPSPQTCSLPENVYDIDAWVAYILSNADGNLYKLLHVIGMALDYNPLNELLLSMYMFGCQRITSPPLLLLGWNRLLFCHGRNFSHFLWKEYYVFIQTQYSLFRISIGREILIDYTRACEHYAASSSPLLIEKVALGQLSLFIHHVNIEFQAGYSQLATFMFQSLLEYNVDSRGDSKINFSRYLESGTPLFGDNCRVSWAKWSCIGESTTEDLLSHVGDTSHQAVIPADHVVPFMFRLPISGLEVLVFEFVRLLGIPLNLIEFICGQSTLWGFEYYFPDFQIDRLEVFQPQELTIGISNLISGVLRCACIHCGIPVILLNIVWTFHLDHKRGSKLVKRLLKSGTYKDDVRLWIFYANLLHSLGSSHYSVVSTIYTKVLNNMTGTAHASIVPFAYLSFLNVTLDMYETERISWFSITGDLKRMVVHCILGKGIESIDISPEEISFALDCKYKNMSTGDRDYLLPGLIPASASVIFLKSYLVSIITLEETNSPAGALTSGLRFLDSNLHLAELTKTFDESHVHILVLKQRLLFMQRFKRQFNMHSLPVFENALIDTIKLYPRDTDLILKTNIRIPWSVATSNRLMGSEIMPRRLDGSPRALLHLVKCLLQEDSPRVSLARELLEKSVLPGNCGFGVVSVWKVFILLESTHGTPSTLKSVCFRGICNCSWSKSLFIYIMNYTDTCTIEYIDYFGMMVDKELHIPNPFTL